MARYAVVLSHQSEVCRMIFPLRGLGQDAGCSPEFVWCAASGGKRSDRSRTGMGAGIRASALHCATRCTIFTRSLSAARMQALRTPVPPPRRLSRMAQATRTPVATTDLSDDPIENISNWFSANQKPIIYGIAAIAIAAVSIFVYRSNDASTREKASRALYVAQAPLSQGKLSEAAGALEKVANRYGSTTAGQQASLLLAHVLFDQKKFDAGIASLKKAQGSASADFAASFEGTIAAGYEAQRKFVDAAEHFGKAAVLAKFPMEKGTFLSSQARALMAGGKLAEARKVWEELTKDESLPFAQEAQVRLGEIVGSSK